MNFVFLIGIKVALKPLDMAVAFERRDVRCQTVKEEAVMADDQAN
jgi:hypothetical protein